MPRRRTHIPFPGARTERPPANLVELCAAYLSRAGPDEFLSHATAARLLGLPLPRRVERDACIHVSVAAPSFAPEVRGVIGHRLDVAPKIVSVAGLPVVNAVDAWLQLGPALAVPELIEVGDTLVRGRRPFTTVAALQRRVREASGRRGVRALRLALERVRPGTRSAAETRLRLALVDAGLPEPLVGFEVTHNGWFVGVPDLAYPVERVAIEYEGDVHRLDLQTFRDDIERRERFEDAGWRVIRVTADHLRSPAALAARISTALVTRASLPRVWDSGTQYR